MLDWPGFPRRSYELYCGLLANAERIERRRGYVLLQAIRGALSEEIPKAYFQATAETEEDATATYNLYRNRVAWERRQAEQGMTISEGGM